MNHWEISLSNRKSIVTDDTGYKKLLDNISSNFVIIDGELINPSFLSSVTRITDPDKIPDRKSPEQERLQAILDQQKADCPICKKTGWVEKKLDDGSYAATPCSCQKIKEITNGLVKKFKINGDVDKIPD